MKRINPETCAVDRHHRLRFDLQIADLIFNDDTGNYQFDEVEETVICGTVIFAGGWG